MDEIIKARLELLAAKAKVLALDYEHGKLWEGELGSGLAQLQGQITEILHRIRQTNE